MTNRLASSLAEILVDAYTMTFGERQFGHYYVNRNDLAQLVGADPLPDYIVHDLQSEVELLGFRLIDIGDKLVVFNPDEQPKDRVLPKNLIDEFVNQLRECGVRS